MTYEEYVDYRRRITRKAVAKRRNIAREHGLCIQCVKQPVVPGKTLCPACALLSRKRQTKYYNKLKRKSENSLEFSRS